MNNKFPQPILPGESSMTKTTTHTIPGIYKFTSAIVLFVATFIMLINSVQGAMDNWTDLGEMLPGSPGASFLTTSNNGEIYGVSASGMAIFRYSLAKGIPDPIINVPGSGTQAAQVAVAPDGKVYIATSRAYGKGNLAVYNPVSGQINDLGSIDTEYSQGLVVGPDGKVYIATCCHGDIAIYDPANSASPWYYMKYPVYNQVRLSGLAVGSDGMIYGVTSRIWISPYGNASLFRLNPATRAITTIGTIYSGVHESWAIRNNPYDGRLYMAVGYGMLPQLYTYDPAKSGQGIQYIGQASGGDNVYSGGLTVAPDGKVYMVTTPDNHYYVFDPTQAQNGLVDLGVGSGGGAPLVFASDKMLYGMNGNHLVRSNQITGMCQWF